LKFSLARWRRRRGQLRNCVKLSKKLASISSQKTAEDPAFVFGSYSVPFDRNKATASGRDSIHHDRAGGLKLFNNKNLCKSARQGTESDRTSGRWPLGITAHSNSLMWGLGHRLADLPRLVSSDKKLCNQPKTDMTSEITTIEHDEPPHSREVEFALILARMITTVKEDPSQLRRTVYEFARAKLKSDISWADEQESARLLAALETAILGVEKFSSQSDQNERLQLAARSGQIAVGSSSAGPKPMVEINQVADSSDDIPRSTGFGRTPAAPVARLQRRLVSTLVSVTFGVLLAGAALGVALYNRHGLTLQTAISSPPQAAAAPEKTVSPPSNVLPFPVPTVYGVYAVENKTLIELDALSEQVPDRRVAMSTPISRPSHNVLSDGHVKFVVFRRDLAALAPERVDVRVVAKVVRALTFDAKGKISFTKVDDAWNIRNIFHEFRVRPLPGNPEMLLMQPEKPDFALPPGRYVLVLKNQGYDFTVAGEMNDPAQCLERTEAANGIFYSDCENKKK
jgi:hypothetical protein